MSTITGTTINSGITLGTSGNYISPLTVASDGAVLASGDAIYGPNTQAWTIVNYNTVVGAGGRGVVLESGGSVSNLGGTALIEGTNAIAVYNAPGVVANSGSIIGTSDYGVILGVGGTVVNTDGVISGNARGVYIYGGGAVTNSGTGVIEGYGGIRITTYAGAVANSATITASGALFDPVLLAAGGSVDNTGTGLIAGYGNGVRITGAAGTVTNSATIIGTNGMGVYLAAGGTVVNSGAISGGTQSIRFGGSGSNLLILLNGYNLTGGVQGSSTATDTVELGGSIGAAVTVSYSGLALTNFENMLFGTAGYSTLLVSNTGTLGVTISGFDQTSEVIDLTAVGNDGTISNLDTVTNQITVSGSAGDVTIQFDTLTGLVFTTSDDGSGGTDLSIACYCRGTLILTDKGEVAVEDLKIGDQVMTLSGTAKPIRWIGHRAYDGRFAAGNAAVLPVRIAAGALADSVPARDLLVSPGHALYFDGALVQAEYLLNGATITQDTAVDRVEYFHIELETHDIIIAEGAPAESYVDCDNRGKFHNAGDFVRLYPDDDRPRWQYCAPLLEWGSEAPNAIRAALIERAGTLGHRLDLDPDLHLVVDGAAIRPEAINGAIYLFSIPAGSAAVALASRSAVPTEVRAASRDRRRLGVPVERLVLQDADLRIEAGHSHASLRDGFHDNEASHRWTNGLGGLPQEWLRAFPGAFTLEVHLIPSALPYRLPAPDLLPDLRHAR